MPLWMVRRWIKLKLKARLTKEGMVAFSYHSLFSKPRNLILEPESWEAIKPGYYARLLAQHRFKHQILPINGATVFIVEGTVMLPASVLFRLGNVQEWFHEELGVSLKNELKKNRGIHYVVVQGLEKLMLAVRKLGRCSTEVDYDE